MTLAAETRAAIRRHPFLQEALRAGVVNYAAAARLLDVEGEHGAVVAALGRYAEALPDYEESAREARVTMRSGLDERTADPESDEAQGKGTTDTPLLRVGEHALVPGAGTRTAILVTGAVDGRVLSRALGRLAVEDITPVAAGFAGRALVVVVSRRDGPTALRLVESVLEAIPG
ncbi:hypothetical protein BRC86_07550 [Halobacteriales archaeon QS_3_64_16]|nr:MAG: hypothetical protein BRC86_07550 [Halobacteriales archaeon QS_3_64_16]